MNEGMIFAQLIEQKKAQQQEQGQMISSYCSTGSVCDHSSIFKKVNQTFRLGYFSF